MKPSLNHRIYEQKRKRIKMDKLKHADNIGNLSLVCTIFVATKHIELKLEGKTKICLNF